jgi:hypothetical protein
MYMAARETVIRPVNIADKVMAGLMWPPEIGNVARRRIAIVMAIKVAITRFGVLVWVS